LQILKLMCQKLTLTGFPASWTKLEVNHYYW